MAYFYIVWFTDILKPQQYILPIWGAEADQSSLQLKIQQWRGTALSLFIHEYHSEQGWRSQVLTSFVAQCAGGWNDCTWPIVSRTDACCQIQLTLLARWSELRSCPSQACSETLWCSLLQREKSNGAAHFERHAAAWAGAPRAFRQKTDPVRNDWPS